MTQDLALEINANFQAFQEKIHELLASHGGKFALMRHGRISDFFDTAGDAFFTGQKLFADGLFSVQEVIESPADLGFYSHAVPQR